MKHGVVASKELAEFLRERSAIEENNYKLLSKVAKQASNSTQGSFAPVWAALRGAAEKLAGLHLQMAQRVTELIKDVSKYADELHKKHKAVRTPACSPWPRPFVARPINFACFPRRSIAVDEVESARRYLSRARDYYAYRIFDASRIIGVRPQSGQRVPIVVQMSRLWPGDTRMSYRRIRTRVVVNCSRVVIHTRLRICVRRRFGL